MTENNKSIPTITDTSSRYYIDANNTYKNGIKYYMLAQNNDDETYNMAYWAFYRAYKSGLMKASFWVAMCYQYGHGVDKNYEAANDYFRTFIKYERDAKTHTDDYAEALYMLSQNVRLGRGTTQDVAKANRYLEKAAKCEHTQAQYEWGARLLFGCEALQNVHDGIEYLKAATKAHNGSITSFVHPDAAALLGWCYNNGFGVKQDFVKAMTYSREARNQNNYAAQAALGENIMDTDKDVSSQKLDIFIRNFKTQQEEKMNPELVQKTY